MENNLQLKPWQITGLTDSSGEFLFTLDMENHVIGLEFSITLDKKEINFV